LSEEALSGNTLIFTSPDGGSLVVNRTTGAYTLIDSDGTSYTGTGARVQNGVLKIHDQSSKGKIDVMGAADGSVSISLKGNGKPRTFTAR
jgi:hypothetical protein